MPSNIDSVIWKATQPRKTMREISFYIDQRQLGDLVRGERVRVDLGGTVVIVSPLRVVAEYKQPAPKRSIEKIAEDAALAHEAAIRDFHHRVIRPSVIYRPRVFKEGNAWCALYGDNLQEGVSGFGATPAAAVLDFDNNWHKAE